MEVLKAMGISELGLAKKDAQAKNPVKFHRLNREVANFLTPGCEQVMLIDIIHVG